MQEMDCGWAVGACDVHFFCGRCVIGQVCYEGLCEWSTDVDCAASSDCFEPVRFRARAEPICLVAIHMAAARSATLV